MAATAITHLHALHLALIRTFSATSFCGDLICLMSACWQAAMSLSCGGAGLPLAALLLVRFAALSTRIALRSGSQQATVHYTIMEVRTHTARLPYLMLVGITVLIN